MMERPRRGAATLAARAMAWVGFAAFAGALPGALSVSAPSATSPPTGLDHAAAVACTALAQRDFTRLRDAPTRIASARYVAVSPQAPEYCEVRARIFPQVGIAIQLPAHDWNGKLLELGCAGYCGTVELADCAVPLRRGYACVASDMGHQASPGDTHWADGNLPAQIDFANRAAHVALLSARAIVGQYYARQISRSYFMGCSTGGYLGMIEAQRFPWDFDGIVAGDPDMDEADLLMRTIWSWRVLRDEAGKPLLTNADLQLLHSAALEACDMSDGVRDGIVGDPLGCPFRGTELLCSAGQTSGCLSALKVAAVRKMYEGPGTSGGMQTSTRGPFPGSELAWLTDPGADPSPDPTDLGYNLYVPTPGQHWREADFDFERDYQRLGLGVLFNDSNPDLRKLRASGAKLIVYQGGNDTVEMAAIYDYYESVEKLMGSRADTQNFFRLYTVPGMGHCGGGAGADHIDYLAYLEAWVERGEAPDQMIGAHTGPPANFTRPVYPYPKYALYTGVGDANDARNFIAVTPATR